MFAARGGFLAQPLSSYQAFTDDANTLLLLHFDGSDGSTSIVDDNSSGRSAKTVTVIGSTQIDTAQALIGSGCLQLDGSFDYLRLDDVAAWDFGDFTIEMWARFNSFGSFNGLATNWESGWYFSVWNNTSLQFYANGGSRLAVTGLSLATNRWYHFAVCRTGSTIRSFIDGELKGSATYATAFTATDPVGIGCNINNSAPADFINGYLDEVRLSNIGRYSSNFSPNQ